AEIEIEPVDQDDITNRKGNEHRAEELPESPDQAQSVLLYLRWKQVKGQITVPPQSTTQGSSRPAFDVVRPHPQNAKDAKAPLKSSPVFTAAARAMCAQPSPIL
ncbi:MAG: hypothetical protein FWC84_00195, partial [Alphaproteobacteria bacterium]|nr:hypothetical protein [Alphaproteobacteria bacterium]